MRIVAKIMIILQNVIRIYIYVIKQIVVKRLISSLKEGFMKVRE